MPLALAGGFFQRFSLVILLFVAVGVILFSFARPGTGEELRAQATDIMAPGLSVISQPITSVSSLISTLANVTELRAENERLKAENEKLRQYQTAAMRLEAENKGLRGLLKMKADPARRVVTAKVIADVGGPFVRNVIVTAGSDDGVRSGLVALAEGGLAGRVISVGKHSSRILLINDVNARVPVLTEVSRIRGMIAGDNSPELQLTQLPPDADIKAGDHLITSGAGGIYPPGLPVGAVAISERGAVRITPVANLGRLEMLQIIDPGTPADLLSPEAVPGAGNP